MAGKGDVLGTDVDPMVVDAVLRGANFADFYVSSDWAGVDCLVVVVVDVV